ncbi:hypothetical protein LT722_24545 [Pseudomonas syringae pv. syringae]|uniref:hypothetical protein n=1 Tax=Pseudomonas syringae TaxID=317 RepID=UPI00200AE0CF|nr:hypothetical protein [Pseudomonas syringae]MCK9719403.1 hypothetical protein [Pseudomonas syringae pv. syringae]MCK9764796.1 hypothetical protein [Pseudomonas syringae pv. syringae]
MSKRQKNQPNTGSKAVDEQELSEGVVLKAIGELLSKKKSDAALAHYPTLRIQTNNIHSALTNAILSTDSIVDLWAAKLEKDIYVSEEFRRVDASISSYRIIAPALSKSMHQTASFLLDETKIIPAVQSKDILKTRPSFSDFVRLGAAARSFLDSLVQTSYQLATFDGKQLNYKFLQSLVSFVPVAPQSIKTNIGSPKLHKILNSYASLDTKKRKDSSYTKASHEQFPQRLEVACKKANYSNIGKRNIELLFNFCSDFVHSGYVSVLALGEPGTDFIMGSADDAFTPRAENFSELKQRILVECAKAYTGIFLPVLQLAIDRTLTQERQWADLINNSIDSVNQPLSITGRKLVEPIRSGIKSGALLRIDCMCGQSFNLSEVKHEWDHYCRFCGSRFQLFEVPEETDYVISSSGPGDVQGSDATKIKDLSPDLHSKLIRIFKKHSIALSKDPIEFKFIYDLLRCDESTLKTNTCVTHAPDELEKEKCDTLTFVAAKSLERCPIIYIECNCGSTCRYVTSSATNICYCSHCKQNIGILGVSGNIEKIETRNSDGSTGYIQVQAKKRS